MAGCVRYSYSVCRLCLSELNLSLEVKGVERDGYNEHVDNTHTHTHPWARTKYILMPTAAHVEIYCNKSNYEVI